MPGRPRRRSQRAVVAYLAFLGILLAFGVDIALIAYDELRVEFALEQRGVSIAVVGTTYFVGMAVGQLFYGIASDRFGRLPPLLFGIGLYSVGALLAAFAPNLEVLLAARLLWGFGAAAPSVLRPAIARDLYDGDTMARVITIVMAVFLIGPIFVPLLGEGILFFGPWQLVFLASLVLAAAAFVWTLTFGETLPLEQRRPFDSARLSAAIGRVFHTRATIGHIGAQTAIGAAFFVYLGSAQPIIDEIYGRDAQFALFFAGSGIIMSAALVVSDRLIGRFGARQVVLHATATFVLISALGVPLALATSGVPSIWAWFAWATSANALSVVIAPMCNALALEPMADIAGTTSAVLGFITFGAGALLAAVVDNLIDGTVTPMIVGSLVFGLIGFCVLVWAGDPVRNAYGRSPNSGPMVRPRLSSQKP